MRASELIQRLEILINKHGNLDIEFAQYFYGPIEAKKVNYRIDKDSVDKPESFIICS